MSTEHHWWLAVSMYAHVDHDIESLLRTFADHLVWAVKAKDVLRQEI
jgi:hypothetical protein